jgi:hypothetical protein
LRVGVNGGEAGDDVINLRPFKVEGARLPALQHQRLQ